MQIECPDCHRPVPIEDVHLRHAMARCQRCNSEFSILDKFPDRTETAPIEKPRVDMPVGITVLERGSELHITQSWFNWGVVPLGIFALFWNGFLVFWYAMALRERQFIMMVFPIAHVTIGVGIAYACLTMLFNRTVIRAGAAGFDVRHGPLPVPGINRLVPGRIEQAYCKEKIHRGKNGSRYTFEVYARIEGGREERIVKGLSNRLQALFIEQAVERHLQIADAPVPGEMGS